MLRFLFVLVLWIAVGCPGAEHYRRATPKAHNRAHDLPAKGARDADR